MADVYKHIHPVKYFTDYIVRNVRPDGRKFDDPRDIKLNINTVESAESSAIVKCGNTTVVCGIKLELAKPKAEESELGFIVPNVEFPPLCSSKFRPGPPSDHAQFVSKIIADILTNSKCINLKDLCIVPDKLAWVVYCNMICLDNDGGVVDACMMTLIATLKSLTLPKVTYDLETEEILVDPSIRTPFNIHGMPVTTSFVVYQDLPRSIILIDPSANEEEICGGNGPNLIICFNEGKFCGIQKLGGSNLSKGAEKKTLLIAKKRSTLVEKVIKTCLENKLK